MNSQGHPNMIETLARLFFPHGSVRPVLWGPLRGYKYIVQPGMGFSYALGRGAGTRFLSDKIAPGSIVFDLGANRGQFALFFAEMAGDAGCIVSFEPVEELADLIRQNVELNGLSNVKVVVAAAAEEEGTAEFAYSEVRSTQGMLTDVEPTYTVSDAKRRQVRTVALDDIATDMEIWPDTIKIDVEGGARAVFEGAQLVLSQSPDIYIELHGCEEQCAVKDALMDRGYVLHTLDGTVIPDPTEGWHSPLWCVNR